MSAASSRPRPEHFPDTTAIPEKGKTTAWLSLFCVVLTIGLTWKGLSNALAYLERDAERSMWLDVLAVGGTAFAALLLIFPLRSYLFLRRSDNLFRTNQVIDARASAWHGHQQAWAGMGYSVAWLTLVAGYFFITTNDFAVQKAFLNADYISRSFSLVLAAGLINVKITLIASVIIVFLSLTLALMRSVPGPAGRPIRVLAIAYVDFFRAIPTIIVLYMVGFGLPLTKLPFVSEWSGTWYAIVALSLSFSAYVSELFRSAIESIHSSQTSAARSLGLTDIQTYRYVIVPQAIRRVIPPLLGFFIALQKDTALVLILGLMDVFGQARFYSANFFNLSPVSLVGILFLVVTIPQTRFVDHLVAKQKAKGLN